MEPDRSNRLDSNVTQASSYTVNNEQQFVSAKMANDRIMDSLKPRNREIVPYVGSAKGHGVNDNSIVRLLILLLGRCLVHRATPFAWALMTIDP